MKLARFMLPGLVGVALAACAGPASDPAVVVEQYFQALAGQDDAKVLRLSCADWEADAQLDLDAFAAYSAALEGVACGVKNQSGDSATIRCNGRVVLDYGGDLGEIQLDAREYLVRIEDGEWRMCGYAE